MSEDTLIDDVLDDLESESVATIIRADKARRPRKKETRKRAPKGMPRREQFNSEDDFVAAKREWTLRRTLERTTSSHVFHVAEAKLAKINQAKGGRKRSRSVHDNGHIKRSDYLTQEQYEKALMYPQSIYAQPTAHARVWTHADFASMSDQDFLWFVDFTHAIEDEANASGFQPTYSPAERLIRDEENANFESAISAELTLRNLQMPRRQE